MDSLLNLRFTLTTYQEWDSMGSLFIALSFYLSRTHSSAAALLRLFTLVRLAESLE